MPEHNQSIEVSPKSTKNEILEAYNALLSKIKDNKTISPQEIKKQQDDTEMVKKVATNSGDKISKNLMELKIAINHELDGLEQKMTTECRQLTDLQAAIKIESQNLQELYEIKKNTDSLAALLLAQKECKQRFEAEMVQQKKELEQEIEQKQNLWSRQEEEYAYSIKIDRKKDKDAYEARKAALEHDLEEKKELFHKNIAEREAALNASEEELHNLQQRVSQFPADLEKAIKDTEKSTRTTIEMQYKYQIDLSAKEIEGERKLSQQIIASLKDKINEQDEHIRQLTHKTNESTNQVQSIALKAIEGSSNMRFYGSYEEGKKSAQQNS